MFIFKGKNLLDPFYEEIKDIYNITECKTCILLLLSAGDISSINIENLIRNNY